jgi:hypothetical protein
MSRAMMAEFDSRPAWLLAAALMAVCLVWNGDDAGATPLIVNGDFTADN